MRLRSLDELIRATIDANNEERAAHLLRRVLAADAADRGAWAAALVCRPTRQEQPGRPVDLELCRRQSDEYVARLARQNATRRARGNQEENR